MSVQMENEADVCIQKQNSGARTYFYYGYPHLRETLKALFSSVFPAKYLLHNHSAVKFLYVVFYCMGNYLHITIASELESVVPFPFLYMPFTCLQTILTSSLNSPVHL